MARAGSLRSFLRRILFLGPNFFFSCSKCWRFHGKVCSRKAAKYFEREIENVKTVRYFVIFSINSLVSILSERVVEVLIWELDDFFNSHVDI